MKLEILQIGAEILTQEAKEVTDFQSPQLQKLIDDMIDTCEADKQTSAGLAAPQVGKGLKVTIVGRKTTEISENGEKTRKNVWKPLINPRIIKESDEETLIWEACLSIGKGNDQLWGPVWRSKIVTVEYEDREGNTKTTKGDGFYSHLLQHEIDHLNGILFLSHVENPDQNIWKSSELDKYIEQYGKYPEAK